MFFGEDNNNPTIMGYWLEQNINEKVKVIKKPVVKKSTVLQKTQ